MAFLVSFSLRSALAPGRLARLLERLAMVVDVQTPPCGCHWLADSAAIGLRSRGRCSLLWPSPVAAYAWR